MIAATTTHDLIDWLTHMNWVDFAFLVILVYSVLTGAWLGFMAECVTLAGVAASTFVAGQTYHDVGTLLGHVAVPKDARDWAGFVAVFVVISVLFRVGSVWARKLSRIMIRGWSNLVAGGLLGLLVGAILCLFIVVTVAYFHVGGVSDPKQPNSTCAAAAQSRLCAVYQSKIATQSTSWLQEFVTLLPVKMHTIPPFLP